MSQYLEDGYPTEAALEKIENWKYDDYENLLSFVQMLWHWGSNQYSTQCVEDDLGRQELEYTFHTGGWSGNEELLSALQANVMFWMMCWYQSQRGGHVKFRIRLKNNGK